MCGMPHVLSNRISRDDDVFHPRSIVRGNLPEAHQSQLPMLRPKKDFRRRRFPSWRLRAQTHARLALRSMIKVR
jgi:hypothetical protein